MLFCVTVINLADLVYEKKGCEFRNSCDIRSAMSMGGCHRSGLFVHRGR